MTKYEPYRPYPVRVREILPSLELDIPAYVNNAPTGSTTRWRAINSPIEVSTCALCGAVITAMTYELHNDWHDKNKQPVKRARSDQNRGT